MSWQERPLRRIFNVSGEHCDLACSRCGTTTDHVSISHGEAEKAAGGSALLGRLGDINPAANLMHGRPFRCTRCRTIRYD